VGVYIDDKNEKCVASINENKVFGETALFNNDMRSATVIAHTNVVKCLVLHKIFYQNIILVK
jgi:CRP-like cAMP-binding protein